MTESTPPRNAAGAPEISRDPPKRIAPRPTRLRKMPTIVAGTLPPPFEGTWRGIFCRELVYNVFHTHFPCMAPLHGSPAWHPCRPCPKPERTPYWLRVLGAVSSPGGGASIVPTSAHDVASLGYLWGI